MIDGSACVIECPVGYVWPLQEDVLCSGGVWLVWAQCIPNGASWTSARVAEILVLVNPGSIPGSQDVMFDVTWVQENLDLMVQTSADLLALSPHKVQIEVLDLAKTRRQRQRRLNAGEFLLRFLVVDDADTTAANLAEQLLCVLFTCTEHGPAWVGSPVLTNATHITHVSVAGFVGDVTSSLLLNSIVVVLEETGSVVPAGMLNCELLVSNSQVRVVYGFVMPVAAWLEGSWMCSTTCGTGVCSRSVSCSLGSSVACAAISSKPQECEECEQCSLNHFCPWPGRDGGSCEVAYVALGAVALLFLCCFLFLCHRRRRLRGKVRLKTIEGTARFSTTWERNEDQSSGSVSTKKRITWEYDQKVLNALYADADLISETGTGLIDGQIVREDERGGDTMSTWLETSGDEALGGRGASMRSSVMETRLFCLDLVGPSDWYDTASSSAQEESSGTLEGHGKTEDEMDVPSSSSTRSQENSSESSAPHHSSASRTTWRSYLLTAMPHEGNAGSLKVRPAYPEKCEVEYYSGTNQCWVTAFVSLSYLEENVNGIQRVIDVIYNIRIGFTLQHRQHVELHLLRKPLLQKELVDVRLPSGVWVPGCISRVARGPRNRIYTVELDDPPNTQQGHQVFVGHQLRRRFPVDSAVCVYCGVSQGWVSGVIAEGTPFVSGSPSAQLRRTGNASTGSASVGSMTSSCFSSPAPPIAKVRKSTDQRRGGASIDVAPFGLGLIAPGQDRVVLVHLADRDEVEWVPEYLVDSVSLV